MALFPESRGAFQDCNPDNLTFQGDLDYCPGQSTCSGGCKLEPPNKVCHLFLPPGSPRTCSRGIPRVGHLPIQIGLSHWGRVLIRATHSAPALCLRWLCLAFGRVWHGRGHGATNVYESEPYKGKPFMPNIAD